MMVRSTSTIRSSKTAHSETSTSLQSKRSQPMVRLLDPTRSAQRNRCPPNWTASADRSLHPVPSQVTARSLSSVRPIRTARANILGPPRTVGSLKLRCAHRERLTLVYRVANWYNGSLTTNGRSSLQTARSPNSVLSLTAARLTPRTWIAQQSRLAPRSLARTSRTVPSHDSTPHPLRPARRRRRVLESRSPRWFRLSLLARSASTITRLRRCSRSTRLLQMNGPHERNGSIFSHGSLGRGGSLAQPGSLD